MAAGVLAWNRAGERAGIRHAGADADGDTKRVPLRVAGGTEKEDGESPRRRDRSLASSFADWDRVTVGGFVHNPGPVLVTGSETLREVVERVGGATPFGTLRRVRLIRDGKLRDYDLSDADAKGVSVLPGDTIEVPQLMVLGR